MVASIDAARTAAQGCDNTAARPPKAISALLIHIKLYIQYNMRIVWDEPKRRTNLATHGFDLTDAESFDWESALVVSGHPGTDGRSRYRAIGRLGDHLVTVVFSPLGTEAISVVSMRAASRKERKLYDKET